mgnify:CR=1 FL=1
MYGEENEYETNLKENGFNFVDGICVFEGYEIIIENGPKIKNRVTGELTKHQRREMIINVQKIGALVKNSLSLV